MNNLNFGANNYLFFIFCCVFIWNNPRARFCWFGCSSDHLVVWTPLVYSLIQPSGHFTVCTKNKKPTTKRGWKEDSVKQRFRTSKRKVKFGTFKHSFAYYVWLSWELSENLLQLAKMLTHLVISECLTLHRNFTPNSQSPTSFLPVSQVDMVGLVWFICLMAYQPL